MAEEQDRASQTEEPTQKRIEDARKKGDVAKSMDVPPLMVLAAVTGLILIGGGWMARSMAEALIPFIAHPETIDLSGQGSVGVMRAAMMASWPVPVVLGVAALAGAAGNFLQHGLLWAPSKLAPDMSKLDLLNGLKRMFGPDGLMNFAKSIAKIVAVSAVAWWVLKPKAQMLQGLSALDVAAILPLSMDILKSLVLGVLALMTVLAGFDWIWSRQRFMARMRMTREQVKREHKESDGDPHVKARQKQLRMQASKRRMIQNVPKATLVVMNPTHYAVALRYVQGETAAPMCVAKGLDRLALKIREIAEEHDIAVIEDPPLARALYASIDVDEAIPQEHYQAVAQIIGFIMGQGRPGARNAPRPTRPAIQ